MKESELYKELGILTRNRDRWEENIPYLFSLLSGQSVRIRAKALWLLGEAGLSFPESVTESVPLIASFLKSPTSLLRERAAGALGRIGRGRYQLIEPFWKELFPLAADQDPKVRLSFIWASENIAVNTPDIYEQYIPVFEKLLHDENDRVRMEAPEMFRVLGSRRPEFIRPSLDLLKTLAETDAHPVVRIHCAGALKAAKQG